MYVNERGVMMDIRVLRYFLMIANEKQITRAAKKLNMAQPPLSQTIKQLENELDVVLFEKNKRELELTEAGKLLYKHAEELLKRLDDSVLEVKEVRDGITGELKIGYLQSCFAYLPDRIRHFQKNFPLVKFRLQEGDPYQIGELLKRREIDLGVLRLPIETQDFEMLPLPKETLLAVFPKEWGAGSSPKKMKDFKDLPLLLTHRKSGTGIYEMIIEECRNNGFEPNIVCECQNSSAVISLVSSGVGASIIPKSSLYSFDKRDIQVVEL
jgi:DNA-binding transcriptional LysR family regulator